MYKAIIAEDEFLVRIGIKTSVDWNSLNIELAGEASNGEEAYHLYLEKRPQIIITDLKMPVMDGMELIRKVREEQGDKDTRFLILSCVDEFALVQKALNYNVSHYFLKIKMTKDEIETVLKSLVKELDKQNKDPSPTNETVNIQMATDTIRSCYKSQSFNPEVASSFLNKLELCIDSSEYVCILISIFQKDTYRQAECIDMASTINIIEKSVTKPLGRVFYLEENLYCVVMYSSLQGHEQDGSSPMAVAGNIKNHINKYLSRSLLAGISKRHAGVKNLPLSLIEARQALNGCFFQRIDIHQCGQGNRFKVDTEYANKLLNLLTANSSLPNLLITEYQKKAGTICKNEYGAADEFKDELCMLLFWLTAQADIVDAVFDQLTLACKKKIMSVSTLDETISIFENFTISLSAASFDKKAPEIIRSVLGYVNENYANNISLNIAANVVHLNPSYLSSLFKKKMHCSFVEYVNITRVKKAQALLRDTDDPIHKIAFASGFTQEEYFYKIFKRLTNLTPNEYRSRNVISPVYDIAGQQQG